MLRVFVILHTIFKDAFNSYVILYLQFAIAAFGPGQWPRYGISNA